MKNLSGLDRVGEALAAVAILSGAIEQRAAGQVLSQQQSHIDAALQSIRSVEVMMEGGGADGYSITNVSPDVIDPGVQYANLQVGQPLDVHLDVRASAQAAGLFLSFGGASIDPGPASSFRIEMGGRGGVATVTVTSGTTVAQIGHVMAAAARGIGAIAVTSGTGVRLISQVAGSNAFVSVRLVESTHLPHYFAGVYKLHPTNTARVDRGSVVRFAMPAALLLQKDHGQDVAALVNGHAATGQGASVLYQDIQFGASIRLSLGPAVGPGNAQTLGVFRAFTLTNE